MAITTTKKNLIYLNQRRCLFIGYMPPFIRSAQASPVLMINLSGYFSVPSPEGAIRTKTILLKAGEKAEFASQDSLVADLMLDHMASDFKRLKQAMRHLSDGIYVDLVAQENIAEMMREIYDNEYDLAAVLEMLRGYFCKLTPLADKPYFDPRIEKIVATICAQPFHNLTIAEFAEQSRLSVPRLVELFKQEMGVPISKYRIWRRLFTAAEKIAASGNITEAAHAAGFCDSSHYSKRFKDTFGVSPRYIFGPDTTIVLKTEKYSLSP